mmetsp:Transcript_42312/g.126841  ORF Transcript_42312/g.126841 Transcript_42312/m.126841 type:complete len:387 (-) Transcript_42312:413-1573(-)
MRPQMPRSRKETRSPGGLSARPLARTRPAAHPHAGSCRAQRRRRCGRLRPPAGCGVRPCRHPKTRRPSERPAAAPSSERGTRSLLDWPPPACGSGPTGRPRRWKWPVRPPGRLREPRRGGGVAGWYEVAGCRREPAESAPRRWWRLHATASGAQRMTTAPPLPQQRRPRRRLSPRSSASCSYTVSFASWVCFQACARAVQQRVRCCCRVLVCSLVAAAVLPARMGVLCRDAGTRMAQRADVPQPRANYDAALRLAGKESRRVPRRMLRLDGRRWWTDPCQGRGCGAGLPGRMPHGAQLCIRPGRRWDPQSHQQGQDAGRRCICAGGHGDAAPEQPAGVTPLVIIDRGGQTFALQHFCHKTFAWEPSQCPCRSVCSDCGVMNHPQGI